MIVPHKATKQIIESNKDKAMPIPWAYFMGYGVNISTTGPRAVTSYDFSVVIVGYICAFMKRYKELNVVFTNTCSIASADDI